MSKKIKQKNRVDRLQAKRARKLSNQARYAELKRQGINGKSKRAKANAKKHKRSVGESHPDGHCGNIACRKCFASWHEIWDAHKERVRNKILLKHPRTAIIVDAKGLAWLKS